MYYLWRLQVYNIPISYPWSECPLYSSIVSVSLYLSPSVLTPHAGFIDYFSGLCTLSYLLLPCYVYYQCMKMSFYTRYTPYGNFTQHDSCQIHPHLSCYNWVEVVHCFFSSKPQFLYPFSILGNGFFFKFWLFWMVQE